MHRERVLDVYSVYEMYAPESWFDDVVGVGVARRHNYCGYWDCLFYFLSQCFACSLFAVPHTHPQTHTHFTLLSSVHDNIFNDLDLDDRTVLLVYTKMYKTHQMKRWFRCSFGLFRLMQHHRCSGDYSSRCNVMPLHSTLEAWKLYKKGPI